MSLSQHTAPWQHIWQGEGIEVLQADLQSFVPRLDWLDGQELRRLRRLRCPQAKRQFVQARCFLKQALAEKLHTPPASLSLSYTAAGKPYLSCLYGDAPRFNLSHCERRAVLALSSRPVGIDLERRRPLAPRQLRPFLHAQEWDVLQTGHLPPEALFALLTRKEAFIKATDKAFGLDAIGFTWTDGQWQLQHPLGDWQFYTRHQGDWSWSICWQA